MPKPVGRRTHQIKAKAYPEKYLHRGKPITLLGVGFDPKTRNIGDWEEETLAQ